MEYINIIDICFLFLKSCLALFLFRNLSLLFVLKSLFCKADFQQCNSNKQIHWKIAFNDYFELHKETNKQKEHLQ